MKLIVGLGNPGRCYALTRHNLGFMVLDALAREEQIAIKHKQFTALCGQGLINQKKILLVKPQTYMNRSGEAVWELLNYYQEQIEDLIIVHDDFDLAWGNLRFKRSGGSGGHNGLKSITRMLNSDQYSRLKIGLGRPPAGWTSEAYVLAAFTSGEKKDLELIIQEAVQGLKVWCEKGLEEAMQKFNSFGLA